MHLAQEANLVVPLGECSPAGAELAGVEMKLKLQIHHLHIHQSHPVVSFFGSLLKKTNDSQIMVKQKANYILLNSFSLGYSS